MTRPTGGPECLVGAAELRSALERVLSDHLGGRRQVVGLERRPSLYRSSFALEELDVALDDGTKYELMFKGTDWHALWEGAQRAKPTFLHDPMREIDVYRSLLVPHAIGPTCYGAVADPQQRRYGLFLERLPGPHLFQVGDLLVWRDVASWLAALHDHFAGVVSGRGRAPAPRLLRYDAAYYRRWLRRARAFASLDQPRACRLLERLESRYADVVARLVQLPTTLIHGEFYAPNILLDQTESALRVCPVDWELAGVGPGLIDLAALTAGSWDDQVRRELALAYRDALMPRDGWPPSAVEFLEALDYCRLQLAVQWLGWSRDWSPPPEHAHDWCDDAEQLADRLGL